MKSSQILGHPPKGFFTNGRGFQSSPIRRVNCGVGNTENNVHLKILNVIMTQNRILHHSYYPCSISVAILSPIANKVQIFHAKPTKLSSS